MKLTITKQQIGISLLALFMFVGFSSFDTGNDAPILKEWVKLGTKKVDFKLDKDVLDVGIKDGQFSKLKLMVSGGNLNMHKMVVHYGNGSKENIELRHNFSKKSASRTIDIKGKDRFIKKIVFIYDTKNASKRKAKIHVFGRR
ncbi:MAG: hypothetical protein AAF466_14465 [Bacteroidota bacterium]